MTNVTCPPVFVSEDKMVLGIVQIGLFKKRVRLDRTLTRSVLAKAIMGSVVVVIVKIG